MIEEGEHQSVEDLLCSPCHTKGAVLPYQCGHEVGQQRLGEEHGCRKVYGTLPTTEEVTMCAQAMEGQAMAAEEFEVCL